MVESNEQPTKGVGKGRWLRAKILDILRRHHILPQHRITTSQPTFTPGVTEIHQPPESEVQRDTAISPPKPPADIIQITTPPRDETEHRPVHPFDRIIQSFRRRVPENILPPKNIDSFDSLFFSQLWENINRFDAFNYTRGVGDEIAYALPFEMRQFDSQYYPFIPRVANWYYIRPLPVWGEHSPLAETYGFEGHIYADKLWRMLVRDIRSSFTTLGNYFNNRDPELIGKKQGKRTPFHRMFLSEKGITFELQVDPTIEQTQRIEHMRDRLSQIIPVNVQIKHGEYSEPLAAPLEVVKEMPMDFVDFSEYSIPVNRDRAVEVSLTPGNRLLVKAYQPATMSPMVYGYGYIQEELRQRLGSSRRRVVVFFFDQTARRHAEALGGFALSQIPSERWKIQRADDIDKKLRAELPEIDYEKVLPDIWHLRPEIITDPLPYTLSVDELNIPCGFRAMMNTETGELTVEVLSDMESIHDPIKRTILERTAEKAAQALKDRGVYTGSQRRRDYPKNEVETTVAKVLPVIRK